MNVQNNSQSITRRGDLKGTLVVDGKKKQVIKPQTNLAIFGILDTTVSYSPVDITLDIIPGYDNQEVDIYNTGSLTPLVVRLKKNDGTWGSLTTTAGNCVRCVYTKLKGWLYYTITGVAVNG